MKIYLGLVFLVVFIFGFGQSDSLKYENIPALIPQKVNEKFGYVDHQKKMVIPAQYDLAMFFGKDCNLSNSMNRKIRKFGSDNYATVEIDKIAYRIDKNGKKVYQYKLEDLGKCPAEYLEQKYKAYVMNGFYGLVDRDYINENNYKEFVIYPQFQRLHVMEGDDIENPMIVAVYNNRFGVINKKAEVIIPFIYKDIKFNFSWKQAHMFEVSEDGQNYFYIDENNRAY